jgi:hypothetical protein
MSKEKSRSTKKDKNINMDSSSDACGQVDLDKMFAAGEISLSKYISARKNVVLSGSYKLDSPIVVDGEEITISGKDKPLLIEVPFNQAFCVNNKGKLSFNNVELRMPLSAAATTKTDSLRINLKKYANILPGLDFSEYVNKIPGLDLSKKSITALVNADNGSTIEFHDCLIEGAADCGIMISQSEFYGENSEINHCRGMGVVLKNSSASLKRLTIAENGTRDMINAQVWIEKSAAVLERCTVRTSRGGDGISLRQDSRVEIRGGSISGNVGNGLALYSSSSADITDCKISENGVIFKTFAQIYLENSSAVIRNCTVNDSRGGSGIALSESRAEVESCAIRHNNNKGFSVKNSSTIEIRDCTIKENATKGKVDAQIYVEKSNAVIGKCSINDAEGNGIIATKESTVEVSASTIKNNTGNAFSIYELSKARMRDCKISGNGAEKKTFAQIFLDDHAIADIVNCEIKNGVGGPGVVLFRESEVSLSSCDISMNPDNGISAFESPRVEIRNCSLIQNGKLGDCYSQIYLDKSSAAIEGCTIRDGHWGYAVYIHGKKRRIKDSSSCDVILQNTKMAGNRLGLRVCELSKLRISGCAITGNREGDTMYDKGSIVTIEDDDANTAD